MNAAIKTVLQTASTDINIKDFETTEAFMEVLYYKIFEESVAPLKKEEPVAAPVVAEKKPRVKKEKDPNVNIDKLNPTQSKKIKAISEELKVEVDKKQLLTYLNAMTPEEFNAKKIEEHVRAFAAPPAAAAQPETVEEQEEVEAVELEFEGKTYLVFADRKVYSMNEDKEPSILAGHVGMGVFKKMEMPEF